MTYFINSTIPGYVGTYAIEHNNINDFLQASGMPLATLMAHPFVIAQQRNNIYAQAHEYHHIENREFQNIHLYTHECIPTLAPFAPGNNTLSHVYANDTAPGTTIPNTTTPITTPPSGYITVRGEIPGYEGEFIIPTSTTPGQDILTALEAMKLDDAMLDNYIWEIAYPNHDNPEIFASEMHEDDKYDEEVYDLVDYIYNSLNEILDEGHTLSNPFLHNGAIIRVANIPEEYLA